MNFLNELITSENVKSHSRFIALLVAFSATVFMWKLIIMGGMSIEYFVAYLAYGMGHQTVNKALDIVRAKFGVNSDPKN